MTQHLHFCWLFLISHSNHIPQTVGRILLLPEYELKKTPLLLDKVENGVSHPRFCTGSITSIFFQLPNSIWIDFCFSPFFVSFLSCKPLRCKPLRCKPLKCKPLRYKPLRCKPLRWKPLRWKPLGENH